MTPTRDSSPTGPAVVWLAAAGLFVHTLDASLVNVALPAIAAELRVDPLAMHSVLIAYLLTVAVVTPLTGTLADRFGVRTAYGGGLLLFCLGAGLCALARNLELLLAARVLQAMGGAMLLPLGRLAVLRTHAVDQRTAALAFVGLPGLVGPLIGPALGGLLVEHAGWRWVFLVTVPPALLSAELVRRRMPALNPETFHRFDGRGYVLIATATLSMVLGLRALAGGQTGLGGLLLAVVAIGVVAYLRHVRGNPAALLPLTPFRNTHYALGMAGNCISRMGSAAMPFMLPTLLQVGLGFDPARAGLLMLAAGTGALSSKALVERLIRRWGHIEVLIASGFALSTIIASFALAHRFPLAGLVMFLLLYGAVNSLLITCLNTFTLTRLDDASISAANSTFSLTVQLSASMAVSIAGVLLQTAQRFGAAPRDAMGMALLGLAIFPVAAACIFLRWKCRSDAA